MNAPQQPVAMGRAAIPEDQVAPTPMAVRQPSRPAPTGPRRCLIVDDSRVMRRVSRQAVEALGYEVIEAENGEEALARCKAEMPDLIMLDWDMPVMTGLEFIAALRAYDPSRRARAVFCTSKSGVHDIHKGIDAGADEYITKPYDEATLRAKLKSIGAL